MKIRLAIITLAYVWVWTGGLVVGPASQDQARQAACYAETEEQSGRPAHIRSIHPEEVFGPLPQYETVIAGIDADALAQTFLPGDALLSITAIGSIPWNIGVDYRYNTGAGRVAMEVGVFQDQQTAAKAFADWWRRRAVVLPLFPGLGDRACLSGENVGVVVNNAVLSVYWRDRHSTDRMLSIGKLIVEQLKTGEEIVTRGDHVVIPAIHVEVSAEVVAGEAAAIQYWVEGDEKVFVEPGVRPARQSGTISFIGTTTPPGTYTRELFFATEKNVIVRKVVSVRVVAQE